MLEGLPSALANAPLSAVDTEAVLLQTLHDQLQTADGPLIVISDRRLNIVDPRLIQFSPDREVENVGIKQFTARASLSTGDGSPSQRFVPNLRDACGDFGRATHSSGARASRAAARRIISLILLGLTRSLKHRLIPRTISRRTIRPGLCAREAFRASKRGHRSRRRFGEWWRCMRESVRPPRRRQLWRSWRLRPICPLRPRRCRSAPPSGDKASGTVNAVAHPITANVDWLTFPATVLTAGEPPRGWMPLVTVGGHVIVAARAEPVRQVWVGFDASTAWTATPDFVIFWANILGWAGQGKERFVAYSLNEREQGWLPSERFPATHSSAELWPGVYQSPLGELRAFNAPSPIPQIGQTTPDCARTACFVGFLLKKRVQCIALARSDGLGGPGDYGSDVEACNLTPLSVARTF